MSKWRNEFCDKTSIGMIKEAIRDANNDNYKKKIDKALSGVAKGKYKRQGGTKKWLNTQAEDWKPTWKGDQNRIGKEAGVQREKETQVISL